MCRLVEPGVPRQRPLEARSRPTTSRSRKQRARELERLAADQRLVGEPARAVHGGAHRAALGDDELEQ